MQINIDILNIAKQISPTAPILHWLSTVFHLNIVVTEGLKRRNIHKCCMKCRKYALDSEHWFDKQKLFVCFSALNSNLSNNNSICDGKLNLFGQLHYINRKIFSRAVDISFRYFFAEKRRSVEEEKFLLSG